MTRGEKRILEQAVSAKKARDARRDDPISFIKDFVWDPKKEIWKQRGLK